MEKPYFGVNNQIMFDFMMEEPNRLKLIISNQMTRSFLIISMPNQNLNISRCQTTLMIKLLDL